MMKIEASHKNNALIKIPKSTSRRRTVSVPAGTGTTYMGYSRIAYQQVNGKPT